ncbi:heavy metal-associated isoprenylated plant protein 19 [Macadamia integrifolia]|uniref:heavy metal-associated isoprenylated plant protein 19 n=1 Tax=Macadamia integrifolia TaxID=60698 RepID=UPI001C4F54AA|nr:heavy metal-associated isoprenylated plant protein 19 [Macadamia integrifolia]
MASERDAQDKAIVVEFRISMHCKACERTVAKTISKIKGVEKFTTDMTKHKVTVMGRMNPKKVLKKLKKKTGKRVEIVGDNDGSNGGDVSGKGNSLKEGSDPLVFGEWDQCAMFTMFSDENPNACLIM